MFGCLPKRMYLCTRKSESSESEDSDNLKFERP